MAENPFAKYAQPAPAEGGGNPFAKYAPQAPAAPAQQGAALEDGSTPLVVNVTPSRLESLARGTNQGGSMNAMDELRGVAAASPYPGADVVNKVLPGPIDLIAGAGRLAAEKLGIGGKGASEAYDRTVTQDRVARTTDAAEEDDSDDDEDDDE